MKSLLISAIVVLSLFSSANGFGMLKMRLSMSTCTSFCEGKGDAPLCTSNCYNDGDAPSCVSFCNNRGEAPRCLNNCYGTNSRLCTSYCDITDSDLNYCVEHCATSNGNLPVCRFGCATHSDIDDLEECIVNGENCPPRDGGIAPLCMEACYSS